MQLVLKHRVQCLQWYITLVVAFASYPCNEHKTHVGRPKCESDTSIVRHVSVFANEISIYITKRLNDDVRLTML